MQEISHLKSLEVLKLRLAFSEEFHKSLANNLKAIGNECKLLKRFQFSIWGINPILNKDIFNAMYYYKQLIYLTLYLNDYNYKVN